MQKRVLGDILKNNAADPKLRDKAALVFQDESLTYGQVNDRVNRLANGLLDMGVERGDRIAVLGRNSDTYVVVYFALAKVGAIMVPINFWYRDREILYTVRQSGAIGLIYDIAFAEVVAQVEREWEEMRWGLSYNGGAGGYHKDLSQVVAGRSTGEPVVEVSEDDPHIILYTSGTTGDPKGATVSHRSHYIHGQLLADTTRGSGEDIGAVIYPLFHTGGPDCLVLPHFLRGATLVVLDGGDPDAILGATEKHGVTNIFCVPTVWRRVLRALDQRSYDVSSVRRCLGSSDTFPPSLLDAILEAFDAEVRTSAARLPYGGWECGRAWKPTLRNTRSR